jgi:hypothetical protein
MKKPLKEIDLAAKVIDWLQSQWWEVYQEVQPHHCGRTADIVAINGPLVWVIETKTSLSLALLEQALRWRGYANYISIATPSPRRYSKGEDAVRLFVKHLGIGRMLIYPNRVADGVDQKHPPVLSGNVFFQTHKRKRQRKARDPVWPRLFEPVVEPGLQEFGD